MSILSIEGVSKRYGETAALDGVSLSVPAGSRTAIVGPSGSGKTTLLRIIAGFEAPDAGRVTLDGTVLANGPAIAAAHKRGVGYVPQDGALFPHLGVAENIGFGLPKAEPDRAARIAELAALVELDQAMLVRKPHELSGGQQQRVALARALARKPALMLLDEPFSALDTGLRESVRHAVARVLEQAGVTAILVTHDQAEALSFADQLAVMRRGRLVQVDTPSGLYWRPVDRDTALFLGDATVLDAEIGDGFADCALGRVAAETGTRRGPGQIMLRPEQIQLSVVPVAEARARHGLVEEVEFSGALCAIVVAVTGSPAEAPKRVRVRSSGLELPEVGASVRLVVRGQAHLLALHDDDQ
jgi:iron(III) transport system ATP-binding protein